MSVRATDPEPVVTPRAALEVLGRAGALLTGSLALDDTLRHVVQLLVPGLGDWCALLVVDEAGHEQEITSHHPDAEVEAVLRDVRARRRLTAGASETLEVLRTGRPRLEHDTRPTSLAELAPSERAVIDRLSPRSYMIVPLRARGRSLGALTLLSATPGRHYTAEDVRFLETLAGRFGLAIDNAQLFASAGRTLALLDTLFATAPVGLAYLDTKGRFVRINEALATLAGRSGEAHVGRTLEEVLGVAAAAFRDAHAEVLGTGAPLLERDIAVPGPEGAGARHWIASFTPVHGAGEELLGVGTAVVDLTERRRLLDSERAARARADFLARAGALLDASLDYEQTLATVARIAVPEVADWCTIRLRDADGVLQHVATTHADPAKEALAAEYEERFPAAAQSGTAEVARSGRAQLVPHITDDMLVAGIADPEQLALVRRLGLRSLIIAPLVARGRALGTLTLATAESDRAFGAEDLQLAEELARRAGVVIENARLYTERARIAHTLQSRLLPDRLPDVPGAELAARYRAAGEHVEVGGDFYDVFERADGSWALVVGDVSGKGPEGAAVTALARYTLRAVAPAAGAPSSALRELNAAMLSQTDAAEFVTVALAFATPDDSGGLDVVLALGGHPPPFVLRAGGEVEPAGELGGILGAAEHPVLTDRTIRLAPADVLLLYTDGVTEAGERHAMLGEAGLAAALEGRSGASAEAIVRHVERVAVAAQPGEPRDDLALLALAVRRP